MGGEGGESHVGAQRNDRLAAADVLAALGGDDDDTVAGAHAVQGGSGLAFQDVDALDVVRVDIQRTGGVVGTGDAVVRVHVRGRGDRHAVHDVQRRIVAGEGTGTTDGDLGGSARHTGRRRDVEAGNLAGHGGSQVGRRALDEVFAGDGLRGVAQRLLFTGDTHGGDHDFLQVLGVGFEGDGHLGCDGNFGGLHAHKGDDQLSRSGSVCKGEFSVEVRQDARGGILHQHIGAHDRLSVGGHDLTLHSDVLCGKGRAHDCQQARHEQFYFFHKHKT